MSIYTDMKEAGVETDNHFSDLYVKDCPAARKVLTNHGRYTKTVRFVARDNEEWLDIPFAYDPFWEEKR